jgi:glycosyltransferase involved in cell wall biosynthesis
VSAAGDVLFVSGTLEIGGSETKIVRIANALASSGYATGIAYLNPPDTLLDRVASDVSVTHLQRSGKFSVKSLRSLRRLVTDRYRVVMSVNFYPLLYVVPAVKWPERGRTKAVGLVNTTAFVGREWVHGHIFAPFLRRCDRLVYGCKAQQELWTGKYRLPDEKATYIYNGVDAEFYSPAHRDSGDAFRAKFGIPADAVVIGSAGRLAPEKNFELLVESIAKLSAAGRPAWLVVLGEGRERTALEHAAARHDLTGRVVFPGVLSDIRPAFAAMDVFVLPSRSETFSNAALEAMSMAVPVVLSNVGGSPEMVEHEICGYLFEAGDVEMLTLLLVKLYDSEALRARLGSAGRQRVLRRFSFGAMLERYKELIDRW